MHVHDGHAVREHHGVHEHEHEAENEREARHGHAFVVEERAGRLFRRRLAAQTILVVRQKAAQALVTLVRRQLRRRAPLRVRRLHEREPARLREHVRSLALAPDRRPVQGRAPFLVLPGHVRVAEEQQLDGVREPFVRRPVQGRAPVQVQRVQMRVPSGFEVVQNASVPVLRGDVRAVVPAHVPRGHGRAAAQKQLGARQRAAHARPMQRRLTVAVNRAHLRALLEQERRHRHAVVQRGPLQGAEPVCGRGGEVARARRVA